jgi:hypothetical protein
MIGELFRVRTSKQHLFCQLESVENRSCTRPAIVESCRNRLIELLLSGVYFVWKVSILPGNCQTWTFTSKRLLLEKECQNGHSSQKGNPKPTGSYGLLPHNLGKLFQTPITSCTARGASLESCNRTGTRPKICRDVKKQWLTATTSKEG